MRKKRRSNFKQCYQRNLLVQKKVKLLGHLEAKRLSLQQKEGQDFIQISQKVVAKKDAAKVLKKILVVISPIKSPLR